MFQTVKYFLYISLGLMVGLLGLLAVLLYIHNDSMVVTNNTVLPESEHMLQIIVTDNVDWDTCLDDRIALNGMVFQNKVAEVHFRNMGEAPLDVIAICYGDEYPVIK